MDRIMIGAASSGCGKTTVSMGVMSALGGLGLRVAPFKVGPDYIDPQFHRFITGRPSGNLDSYLLKRDSVREILKDGCRDADIAVIEGVMGLYDGLAGTHCTGSSAHVSKITGCPVVLVLDGKGISTSIAAQVMGYRDFDSEVDIAGVIVNRVSGQRHYEMLRDEIERHTGVKCFGYLPLCEQVELSSRHLGLVPAGEDRQLKSKVDAIAQMAKMHIDIEGIAKAASSAKALETGESVVAPLEGRAKGLRLAVAMDDAFSFYYDANLKLLMKMGFQLEFFSPIRDRRLPDGIDGIYIGGGFPEVFAEELEANSEMRMQIRQALERGMFAYAECGGLMYLTRSITGLDGREHEMAGFFQARAVMTGRLQRFGYVSVECDNVEGPIRAHEFHRSVVEADGDLKTVYRVTKSGPYSGGRSWECGYSRKNVIAGYPHVHFYSNLEFVSMMANRMTELKK